MRPNPTRRGIMLAGAPALISPKSFATAPACVLASEQEEAPYYVDGAKLRRDITEGKPGVPVALFDSRSCAPLPDAALDTWHCDASAVYSGFTSANADGRGQFRPGGRGPRRIDDTCFVRGVQLTSLQGVAEFTTRVAHTGQLFFPEGVTEHIAKMQPFADRLRVHRTIQQEDAVVATVTVAIDPQ